MHLTPYEAFGPKTGLVEVTACSHKQGTTWLTLWDIYGRQRLEASTTDPDAANLKPESILRCQVLSPSEVKASQVSHRQLKWRECLDIVLAHSLRPIRV